MARNVAKPEPTGDEDYKKKIEKILMFAGTHPEIDVRTVQACLSWMENRIRLTTSHKEQIDKIIDKWGIK